jgi:hypothetical protein
VPPYWRSHFYHQKPARFLVNYSLKACPPLVGTSRKGMNTEPRTASELDNNPRIESATKPLTTVDSISGRRDISATIIAIAND